MAMTLTFLGYVTSNVTMTLTHPVDPRSAQFILGRVKIYFQFLLFLNTEMAEVLKALRGTTIDKDM